MYCVSQLIEATIERVENENREWMAGYEADNRALLRFLKGCCLAAMNLPRLALDTLDAVFQLVLITHTIYYPM